MFTVTKMTVTMMTLETSTVYVISVEHKLALRITYNALCHETYCTEFILN